MCVPPAIFLISFLPWCTSSEAIAGILNNVFLYRSYNNYPLLGKALSIIGVENFQYFKIYIALMLIVGLFLRKMEYKTLIMWYFVAMVAFSSAIANQYLVIPLVALCACEKRIFYWLYCACGAIYCVLNGNELNFLLKFNSHFPFFEPMFNKFAAEGGFIVSIMAWILVAFLIWSYIRYRSDFFSPSQASNTHNPTNHCAK